MSLVTFWRSGAIPPFMNEVLRPFYLYALLWLRYFLLSWVLTTCVCIWQVDTSFLPATVLCVFGGGM